MVTHFSILVWEIPRTEDLVGYSPWGYKRVGHNLVTKQTTKTDTNSWARKKFILMVQMKTVLTMMP
jgi:hypothetical protein